MFLYILFFVFFFALLFFLIASSVFVSGLIYSILKGAPYVPTSKHIISEMLKRAHLKKGMKFLELGSGTGRIVSEAVSKYGVYGVGVEINPILHNGARIRGWLSKLDTVEFIQKNVKDVSFKGFDVIYLYLFPALIDKLEPRFKTECKKGTIIISHGFRITGLSDKLIDTMEKHTFKTFFYKI